jgi:hypothetical protein
MTITRVMAPSPWSPNSKKLLVYDKGSFSGSFIAVAINGPSVLRLGKSVSASSNYMIFASVALFFQRYAVTPLASRSTIRTIMVPRGSSAKSWKPQRR